MICTEEEEVAVQDITKLNTFTPDYERIKYAIDGIRSIYSSKKFDSNLENISEYPGIRIFDLRSSTSIKKRIEESNTLTMRRNQCIKR